MQPTPPPAAAAIPEPPSLSEATAYLFVATGNLLNALAAVIRSGGPKLDIGGLVANLGQNSARKAA